MTALFSILEQTRDIGDRCVTCVALLPSMAALHHGYLSVLRAGTKILVAGVGVGVGA